MNYIELEIGGEKRGFRFGLGCLGEMLDVLNIGMDDLQAYINRNPIKGIPVAIYCAAKCHLEDKDQKPDFSKNDVSDWILELEGGIGGPDVEKLMGEFAKSLENLTGAEIEEGPKKK